MLTATVTMTTGTMFLMWLGEQITERGIGNGISMIILSGIVAGLPGAVGNTIESVSNGEMQGPFALLLLLVVLATTYFVVYVERAQRRIPVDYAKRQVGRRMYAGQSQPPAVQAQHVGRDPADLRLEPALVPGDARQLRRHRRHRHRSAPSCRTWPPRSATGSRCTW